MRELTLLAVVGLLGVVGADATLGRRVKYVPTPGLEGAALRAAGSPPPPPRCNGGACCGMAHYPVKGTHHYAEFDVPRLPSQVGPTFFVYYNIDWQGAGPKGSDARMNQFVPQLMLGNPLSGSTGPPLYHPTWHPYKTWVFGAQYFFELHNATANRTQAHAATGTTFPTKEGEILYTRFDLSADWVWTLTMGVKGDASRTSTVVAEKPFMGLIEHETSSWSEPVYSAAWSNSCWELYGIREAGNYPQTGMDFDMRVTLDEPGSVKWDTKWHYSAMTCPGHPQQNVTESHTDARQDVAWKLWY